MAGDRKEDRDQCWPGGGSGPTPEPSAAPTSCNTGSFDVTVSSGPTLVPCGATGGQCTEIEYQVVPSPPNHKKPSHVFALEGVGVWAVQGPGNQWYAPCDGDPVIGLGRNSCHEQAIKINPNASTQKFKIILAGARSTGPTSVATMKGHDVGACRILGIGYEAGPNPDQAAQGTETIDFKGCVVQFTRDPLTGEVVKAELLTPETPSGEECQSPTLGDDNKTIAPRPVVELAVSLAGYELGTGKFGDGYISTGTDSCTTRVIGGKVYTWGSPCPPK
jgi:hypothetical protein